MTPINGILVSFCYVLRVLNGIVDEENGKNKKQGINNSQNKARHIVYGCFRANESAADIFCGIDKVNIRKRCRFHNIGFASFFEKGAVNIIA